MARIPVWFWIKVWVRHFFTFYRWKSLVKMHVFGKNSNLIRWNNICWHDFFLWINRHVDMLIGATRVNWFKMLQFFYSFSKLYVFLYNVNFWMDERNELQHSESIQVIIKRSRLFSDRNLESGSAFWKKSSNICFGQKRRKYIVMRRAAPARRRLLFCQNLGEGEATPSQLLMSLFNKFWYLIRILEKVLLRNADMGAKFCKDSDRKSTYMAWKY